jgi:hypothetical protein
MCLKTILISSALVALSTMAHAATWSGHESEPAREIASQSIQCHTLYMMLADSQEYGRESIDKAVLMGDLYRVSSAANGHAVSPWDLTVAQRAMQKTFSGIAELNPTPLLNQLERCEGWSSEIAGMTDSAMMPWMLAAVPLPRDFYLLDPIRMRGLIERLNESLDPERTTDASRFVAGSSAGQP